MFYIIWNKIILIRCHANLFNHLIYLQENISQLKAKMAGNSKDSEERNRQLKEVAFFWNVHVQSCFF